MMRTFVATAFCLLGLNPSKAQSEICANAERYLSMMQTRQFDEYYMELESSDIYNHMYTTVENPSIHSAYIQTNNLYEGYLWYHEKSDVNVALYRQYSETDKNHYYTISDQLWDDSYSVTGTAGYVMTEYCDGINQPLYQYWSDNKKDHLYNLDYDEIGQGNGDYELVTDNDGNPVVIYVSIQYVSETCANAAEYAPTMRTNRFDEYYMDLESSDIYNHMYTTVENPSIHSAYEQTSNLYEGYLWYHELSGINVALYRQYSTTDKNHYYTTSDELWDDTYSVTGTAGYVMTEYCVGINEPLYQYWSYNKKDHLYNLDYHELGQGDGDYELVTDDEGNPVIIYVAIQYVSANCADAASSLSSLSIETNAFDEYYLALESNEVYNHVYTTVENPSIHEAYEQTSNINEGYLWYQTSDVTVPLYRQYSTTDQNHYYTTSDQLWDNTYSVTGTAGYVMTEECPLLNEPLYQYWSDNKKDHLYNSDYNQLGEGDGDYQLVTDDDNNAVVIYVAIR